MLVAANKIDALDDPDRLARLEATPRGSGSTLFPCRPSTGEGLPPLLEAVWRRYARTRCHPARTHERRASGSIGILGGTLDPIHLGHVATARAPRGRALGLDRVVVIPALRAAAPPESAGRFRLSPVSRWRRCAPRTTTG